MDVSVTRALLLKSAKNQRGNIFQNKKSRHPKFYIMDRTQTVDTLKNYLEGNFGFSTSS
jgi:hypothetical protein